MYFSVHRHHGGNYYPYLQSGGPSTIGKGKGTGFNANVGWNKIGMGDKEYISVWEKVLMPMAMEYKPDLVLVSAGFDCAKGDLGECNVSPACFGWLTKRLLDIASGRIVCSLEGGYVGSVLGKCVESVVRVLTGGDCDHIAEIESLHSELCKNNEDLLDNIDKSAAKSIRTTIAAHRPYWKCFQESIQKGAKNNTGH